MSGKLLNSPDTPPLQDILHAAGHRGIAADLQRVAGAHREDQVVIQQSRLHSHAHQTPAVRHLTPLTVSESFRSHNSWLIVLMLEEVGHQAIHDRDAQRCINCG